MKITNDPNPPKTSGFKAISNGKIPTMKAAKTERAPIINSKMRVSLGILLWQ